MQIVIPMSGFGERFRKAGHALPKPLMEIDRKPIIAHVLDMFPGERRVVFICNQRHLDEHRFRMESILRELCPTGRIIGIPPHSLGPVHAVRQAEQTIDAADPVVVNYCDFCCYWDWRHFKQFVRDTNCAGAIAAYKGFHPHSLGSTNYAYMRVAGCRVVDIQEKQPYTDHPMREFASSGTYYFKSGAAMLNAFRMAMEHNLQVGGEYYVSLSYKPLLAAGQSVVVYPLQHFMQWGTPEDVAEYRGWSESFRRLSAAEPNLLVGAGPTREHGGSVIVSMAGLGQRFVDAGYRVAKPLISVSGRPMAVQAVTALPGAEHYVFVLRAAMPGARAISDELRRLYPTAIVKTLPAMTEGPACTAVAGLDALEQAVGEVPGPVTLGACDHGALYDRAELRRLVGNPGVDVIVWAVRGHAGAARHPHMFGWIEADNYGRISTISVKEPLQSPVSDPIVAGTFTFRRGDDFRRCAERLVERNGRVDGEFYVDSCINDAVKLGLHCHLFELDSYMSWGTPNDLRTFEYWQSCFHKWAGHPYRVESDPKIPFGAVPDLVDRYGAVTPGPEGPGGYGSASDGRAV